MNDLTGITGMDPGTYIVYALVFGLFTSTKSMGMLPVVAFVVGVFAVAVIEILRDPPSGEAGREVPPAGVASGEGEAAVKGAEAGIPGEGEAVAKGAVPVALSPHEKASAPAAPPVPAPRTAPLERATPAVKSAPIATPAPAMGSAMARADVSAELSSIRGAATEGGFAASVTPRTSAAPATSVPVASSVPTPSGQPFMSRPFLVGWKTSVGWSIAGVLLGPVIYGAVAFAGVMIAYHLVEAYANAGHDVTLSTPLYMLIGMGGQVTTFVVGMWYAYNIYPSFYTDKPRLKSAQAASFWNIVGFGLLLGWIGALIVGPLANGKLTERRETTIHRTAAGVAVAFLVLNVIALSYIFSVSSRYYYG